MTRYVIAKVLMRRFDRRMYLCEGGFLTEDVRSAETFDHPAEAYRALASRAESHPLFSDPERHTVRPVTVVPKSVTVYEIRGEVHP